MRNCKDCARELEVSAFSPGTNWRQCRKCKSQQVQLHKYRGTKTVKEWQSSTVEYFQDFLKAKARRAQILSAKPRTKPNFRRLTPEKRQKLSVSLRWANVILANKEAIEHPILLERKARNKASRRRSQAKLNVARKANPEPFRAKDRQKRAAKPELYKAHRQRGRARREARCKHHVLVPLNEIWDASNGICNICSSPCDPEWWHADHIIPVAAGGDHSLANLAPAHPYCNTVKGKRLNDTLDLDWLIETRPVWEAGEAAKRMRLGQTAPCGTANRYFRGCRCRACKDARNDYSRELRKRKGLVPKQRTYMPIADE